MHIHTHTTATPLPLGSCSCLYDAPNDPTYVSPPALPLASFAVSDHATSIIPPHAFHPISLRFNAQFAFHPPTLSSLLHPFRSTVLHPSHCWSLGSSLTHISESSLQYLDPTNFSSLFFLQCYIPIFMVMLVCALSLSPSPLCFLPSLVLARVRTSFRGGFESSFLLFEVVAPIFVFFLPLYPPPGLSDSINALFMISCPPRAVFTFIRAHRSIDHSSTPTLSRPRFDPTHLICTNRRVSVCSGDFDRIWSFFLYYNARVCTVHFFAFLLFLSSTSRCHSAIRIRHPLTHPLYHCISQR